MLAAFALAGCGGAGGRPRTPAPPEFLEMRRVVASDISGVPEWVGYYKRYRRALSHDTYFHWVEVFDRRGEQVGLVEESGRTQAWVRRDGAPGRWVDLGNHVLERAVAKLLNLSGPFDFEAVGPAAGRRAP